MQLQETFIYGTLTISLLRYTHQDLEKILYLFNLLIITVSMKQSIFKLIIMMLSYQYLNLMNLLMKFIKLICIKVNINFYFIFLIIKINKYNKITPFKFYHPIIY